MHKDIVYILLHRWVQFTLATAECTVVSMERSWRRTSLWATSISACTTWCRTSFRCCHHLHTATQHTLPPLPSPPLPSPPLSSLLCPSPPFPSPLLPSPIYAPYTIGRISTWRYMIETSLFCMIGTRNPCLSRLNSSVLQPGSCL